MSTLKTLQDQRLQFKKEGEAKLATLLSTVLGDYQNRMSRGNAGEPEAELQAVLRYFLKNIKEFKANLEKIPGEIESERYKDLLAEEIVIEQLLPELLSEDDLRSLISTMISDQNLGPKDKGKVMSALKAAHAGRYDGKQASQLVTEMLS
ncbi:GatB/YqeY domain-containing protein (plasmid) [Pseudomonas sp. FeN3W]|nr:GatB/YqeY domain-containing protein [Pseudomonas sp. FeN3W]